MKPPAPPPPPPAPPPPRWSRALGALVRHELEGLAASPATATFLVAFVFAAGVGPVALARFFEAGRADMDAFFLFHPWLHVLLGAALAMRLWAEDRREGALELLVVCPVSMETLALAKHLAAWLFMGLALVLTMPAWLFLNWLGAPDNLAIAGTYLGSWLAAGCFTALGGFASAFTRNQIAAFAAAFVGGFLFAVNGLPFVAGALDRMPAFVGDAVETFSVLSHFGRIREGAFSLAAFVFFFSFMATFVLAAAHVARWRQGGQA